MMLARVLRVTLAKIVLALYRTRFIGEQNVPVGGAILAGNHSSYLDPVLMWCGAPRHVHFMAKSDLWDSRLIGWGLDHLWGFPVRRGQADRGAITRATGLLGDGELVGIFPEGTRVRHRGADALGEAQGGVAFIAMRAGAPVVPVGISGTERALPDGARIPRFPKVTVRYGEPIHPDTFDEGGRKERVEAMTTAIMEGIVEARRIAREA